MSTVANPILLVEDNLAQREEIEDALNAAGYVVSTATSYDEAIAQLQRAQFDVAIVDLEIPEYVDGNPELKYGGQVINYISSIVGPKPKILVRTGHDDIPIQVDRNQFDLISKKSEGSIQDLKKNVAQLATSKWVEEDSWKYASTLPNIAVRLDTELKARLKQAQKLTQADSVHLLFMAGHDLRISVNVSGPEPKDYRVPIDSSITGLVFRTCEVINEGDVKHSDKPYHRVADADMNSELAVPLLEDGKPIGVLNFESHNQNAFDKKHEDIARVFADLVVVTLKNEKQRQVWQATSTLLSEVLESSEVQRSILQIGVDQLNAQTGSLLLREGEELVVQAAIPEGLSDAPQIGTRYRLRECVSGFAVLKRELINVPDLSANVEYQAVYQLQGQNMLSEIVAPLEVGGEIIGVLNFESQERAAFTRYDEDLLLALAKEAAIALEKTHLIEEVKKKEKIAGEVLFATEVVHRLNNPMGAVRAFVLQAFVEYNFLLEQNPGLKATLQDIQKNAERSMALVRELRQKSRQVQAQVNLVDVGESLRQALAIAFVPEAITICQKIHPERTLVRADEQLARVFVNLIQNAVEAMEEDGQLNVGSELAGDKVKAWVQDTGHGIPLQYQPLVFTGAYTTKPDKTEHGIGLWWVKNHIEALDGEISFVSEAGKGTTFIIYLPLRSSANRISMMDKMTDSNL